MIRLVAMTVAWWLAAGMAAAQGSDEGRACTPAGSIRVSIDDLWAESRELRDRCVAIEGYRLGDAIFTEQRAFYRYAARMPPVPRGIIGIPYPLQLDDHGAGLMHGTYYGRVEICRETQRSFSRALRRMQESPPSGEIVLIHLYGYCRNSEGPAVRVERADERPSADLRRLAGDDLRNSLGELVPVDDGYPWRAVLPWMTDIVTQGGCREEFAPPGLPAGGPPEGNGVSLVLPTLGPTRLGRLRRWCATQRRDRALFAVADGSPSHEPGSRLDVVICLCLTEDCAGQWPVSLIDTGWGIERPYFCQRVALRPRQTSYAEGEAPEYSDYLYEFADAGIVPDFWQDRGFPEP